MSPLAQVDALEQAILERAKALADEHLQQAARATERIRRDSAERLRLMEEKEVLLAKDEAEREYRRLVQASEIRMQAELDRLRWGLIESVMDGVQRRLHEIQQDEAAYLALFQKLLAQGARAIEREQVKALLSEGDQLRLKDHWQKLAAEAVPDKTVLLASEVCPCSGGVLVRSEDDRISVNNTFEGRMERFEAELHRIIMERLFPSAVQLGSLANG